MGKVMSTINDDQLNPCSCGSNDLYIEETLSNEPWHNFFIVCSKCEKSYGPGDSEQQIIQEWNESKKCLNLEKSQ